MANLNTGSASIKQNTPFPTRIPEELLKELAADMILNNYSFGVDEEIDEKVSSGYEKLMGIKFSPVLIPPESDGNLSATVLAGPPGHGKSSIFKAATKLAAESMGMRWITMENLEGDYIPTKNDFLFIVKEMAGQVSATTFAGIPSKGETANNKVFMDSLADKSFVLARYAGSAFMLLDDLGNALPSVIPAVLGVVEDRRYGTHTLGDRCMVGITTNLGKSKDGTTGTNDLGTAVRGRCKTYYMEDTVDAWIDRYEKKMAKSHMKEFGDNGFIGFLRSNDDIFLTDPPRDGGAYPTPRSLEKMSAMLQRTIYEVTNGGTARTMGADKILRLENSAAGFIGKNAASKLSGYYYSYLTGVQPLLNDYFSDDASRQKRAIEQLKEKISDGVSDEKQDYIAQVCFGAVDLMASKIINIKSDNILPEVEEIARRTSLLHGLTMGKVSNSPAMNASITHFKQRLENQIDECHLNDAGTLGLDVTLAITKGYTGMLKGTNSTVCEQFVDALSNAGAFRQCDDFLDDQKKEELAGILSIDPDLNSSQAMSA